MEILIIIFVVWYIVKKRNTGGNLKNTRKQSTFRKQQASAAPNRPKKRTSAIPNVPKKFQRNREEAAMEVRTRASRKACNYEAAYSKGRPHRVGRRGDYEPSVPNGMSRIRCAYCGAENFVPAGTHEHYHCYFCWEKL